KALLLSPSSRALEKSGLASPGSSLGSLLKRVAFGACVRVWPQTLDSIPDWRSHLEVVRDAALLSQDWRSYCGRPTKSMQSRSGARGDLLILKVQLDLRRR